MRNIKQVNSELDVVQAGPKRIRWTRTYGFDSAHTGWVV